MNKEKQGGNEEDMRRERLTQRGNEPARQTIQGRSEVCARNAFLVVTSPRFERRTQPPSGPKQRKKRDIHGNMLLFE
jgi:hypothetical protein